MHVGAPPHFLLIVRRRLNWNFGEEWTERRGLVDWLKGSLDLNRLNFWLWGHLKTLIYSAPINDLEVLQQRAGESSENINFRQSVHLYATKSWKLCWNVWEPHRTSAVEITAGIGFWTYYHVLGSGWVWPMTGFGLDNGFIDQLYTPFTNTRTYSALAYPHILLFTVTHAHAHAHAHTHTHKHTHTHTHSLSLSRVLSLQ
jgi:hypothetical protein